MCCEAQQPLQHSRPQLAADQWAQSSAASHRRGCTAGAGEGAEEATDGCAAGGSAAGGSGGPTEAAGMMLYLSDIKEWVVEFGCDMLHISLRTDVAWYRLGR